jgi:glutaminase
MPSFDDVCAAIKELYPAIAASRDGHNANYIPELAAVNPDLFGVAVCSCDGRLWSMGDDSIPFTFQSTIKPLLYNVASKLVGNEEVHRHIGYEPSGRRFNAFVLDDDNKPHNPLINAGAIMSSAIIRAQHDSQVEAFKAVKHFAERCSGMASPVSFDNSIFLSELGTASRNYALTYFMRECSEFLQTASIERTLELYFSACSLGITCRGLAAVAATYANGGTCPLTRDRVMDPVDAQRAMQIMFNCGMYDYSGRFAFEIGIPAKSGVSGALFMCVPGRFGIAVWSPPLDAHGNSTRGVRLATQLVERFQSLHMFGQAIALAKSDAGRQLSHDVPKTQMLIHAASTGDGRLVEELVTRHGVDVNVGDYDGRTALHLAFAEGHRELAAYLIKAGANLECKDRFGSTPRSEAINANLEDVLPPASADPVCPSPLAALPSQRPPAKQLNSTSATTTAAVAAAGSKPRKGAPAPTTANTSNNSMSAAAASNEQQQQPQVKV